MKLLKMALVGLVVIFLWEFGTNRLAGTPMTGMRPWWWYGGLAVALTVAQAIVYRERKQKT